MKFKFKDFLFITKEFPLCKSISIFFLFWTTLYPRSVLFILFHEDWKDKYFYIYLKFLE